MRRSCRGMRIAGFAEFGPIQTSATVGDGFGQDVTAERAAQFIPRNSGLRSTGLEEERERDQASHGLRVDLPPVLSRA